MSQTRSQTFFALELRADLQQTNGHFVSRNTGRKSRVWVERLAGDNSWRDTAIDPDTPGASPVLNYRAKAVAQADTFRIIIYFNDTDPDHFSSITISAVFTPKVHDGVPVVSPFRDQLGNVQPIVAATWLPNTVPSPTIYLDQDPGSGDSAIVFKPGPFSIDPIHLPPGPAQWQFEFTIVAQFTYQNGVTRQYAYDPEMEIEVSSSGAEPLPLTAYA